MQTDLDIDTVIKMLYMQNQWIKIKLRRYQKLE